MLEFEAPVVLHDGIPRRPGLRRGLCGIVQQQQQGMPRFDRRCPVVDGHGTRERRAVSTDPSCSLLRRSASRLLQPAINTAKQRQTATRRPLSSRLPPDPVMRRRALQRCGLVQGQLAAGRREAIEIQDARRLERRADQQPPLVLERP